MKYMSEVLGFVILISFLIYLTEPESFGELYAKMIKGYEQEMSTYTE